MVQKAVSHMFGETNHRKAKRRSTYTKSGSILSLARSGHALSKRCCGCAKHKQVKGQPVTHTRVLNQTGQEETMPTERVVNPTPDKNQRGQRNRATPGNFSMQ